MNDVTEKIRRAVKFAGGQVKFAAICGVRQTTVSNMLSGRKLSAKTAIAVERATNGAITREELCPDIFG